MRLWILPQKVLGAHGGEGELRLHLVQRLKEESRASTWSKSCFEELQVSLNRNTV